MNTGAPREPRTPAKRFSEYGRTSWGPYWEVLFAPAMISGWINWKRASTGVNVARLLWGERENARRTYETVHGSDPHRWPTRHPGAVVEAVIADASAVCLRCDYFEPCRSPDQAARAARHHEQSRGRYRGSMDQRRAQWDRFVAEQRNQ